MNDSLHVTKPYHVHRQREMHLPRIYWRQQWHSILVPKLTRPKQSQSIRPIRFVSISTSRLIDYYQAKQRQETKIVTTIPSPRSSSGSMSQTNYLHIPLPTRFVLPLIDRLWFLTLYYRPTSLTIANENEKKRFLPVNSPSTKLLRKLSLWKVNLPQETAIPGTVKL